MSKKTLLLILSLAGVTILLIFVAVSPKKQIVSPKTPKAVITPAVKKINTIISMSPASLSISSNSGSLSVDIDPKGQKITGIQLEMAYDPAVLGNVDITPSSLFKNSLVLRKEINKTKGTISLVMGVPPTTGAKKGTGQVAKMTFTVLDKSKKQTVVRFMPETIVTAEGLNYSVLKMATGATIVFTSANTITSPSPLITQ